MLRLLACAVMTLWAASAVNAVIAGGGDTSRHDDGLWKYRVPKHAVQGEFAGFDVKGLNAGVCIPTDCSLRWLDAVGRIYCFSSGTSLAYFLELPQTNIALATERWRRQDAKQGQTACAVRNDRLKTGAE